MEISSGNATPQVITDILSIPACSQMEKVHVTEMYEEEFDDSEGVIGNLAIGLSQKISFNSCSEEPLVSKYLHIKVDKG